MVEKLRVAPCDQIEPMQVMLVVIKIVVVIEVDFLIRR